MKNVGRNLFFEALFNLHSHSIYFWQKICRYQFHRGMIKNRQADVVGITQQTFTCSNSAIEILHGEAWNMLKVNNKEIRTNLSAAGLFKYV